MRKNNVDIVRACALLIMVVYHAWVLTGSAGCYPNILLTFVMLGGEIGVTAFFVLSGFGIFYSLQNQENKDGCIRFAAFICRRFERIMPEYYFNIIVCLFISTGAVWVSKRGLIDLLLHTFFVHNLFEVSHGSINGVLWTMGVIVQFYIIAIPLYRLLKRNNHLFVIGTIVLTVVVKWFVYSKGVYLFGDDSPNLFVAGRQLPTALDNFTIGMYVASLVYSKNKCKSDDAIGGALILLSLIALYFCGKYGLQYGIHTNNLSGYTWHTVLAVILGVIIYAFATIDEIQNKLTIPFKWLAKYEYSIYLWHLLMINTLIASSPYVKHKIQEGHYILIQGILVIFSIMIGYIMNKGPRLFETIINKSIARN